GEQAGPAPPQVTEHVAGAAYPQVAVVLAGEAGVRLVLAGGRRPHGDRHITEGAPPAQQRVRLADLGVEMARQRSPRTRAGPAGPRRSARPGWRSCRPPRSGPRWCNARTRRRGPWGLLSWRLDLRHTVETDCS